MAGGVSSVIMGGDFGEGALQGGLVSAGSSVGQMLAPMASLGQQDHQGGDIAYLKPENLLTAMIPMFEGGGPFSHTITLTGNGMMAHSTLGGGAQAVPISQEYLNRGAYISKRFRGNQGFINAAAINRAGYSGWYGIGPNSQARGLGYSQFGITNFIACSFPAETDKLPDFIIIY